LRVYHIILLMNSALLALLKPLNLDLLIYNEWILDPDYYSFDPFFNAIGDIVRLFGVDIRGFVFAISLCLQYLVARITLRIFPAVSLSLIAIVGATAFWNITLSSNVMRQGMAIIIFLCPLIFFSNKSIISRAIFNILSILTHWSMIIFVTTYYLFRGGVYKNKSLKVVFVLICLAFLPIIDNYFDVANKVMFYAKTELFDESRSSQVPRFLMQFSLLMIAYVLKIIPNSLRFYVFVIAIALIFSISFPEVFSRISLASGMFLHVVYYGYIFSSDKLSYNLKFAVSISAFFIQLMHPSTRVLLEL